MKRAKPGRWTLEQIPRIVRYIERLVKPGCANIVDFQKLAALSSLRRRCVASDRKLKLENMEPRDYAKKFVTPRALIVEEYKLQDQLSDEEPLFIRNSMGYTRNLNDGVPAFTVLSSNQSYGNRVSKMKPCNANIALKMMGLKPEEVDWTGTRAENSETQKIRCVAQCVPPRGRIAHSPRSA